MTTDPIWPAVTASLLADHEALLRTHVPSEINQSLFALIRARKALGDARLALATARRLAVRPEVKERLTELSLSLTSAHDRFPLTLLQNAPSSTRARPKIFAEHD